jgi:hypothetical protein
MSQRTLKIPSTLKHANEDQTDAALQAKAREHFDRHPGLQFLADVLRALHAQPEPLRSAKAFFNAFRPQHVMDALAQRPDLRVRTLKALTGGPNALLRRLTASAVASQIELLATEDLPEAERSVRAEGDRPLSVYQIYLKYLDPMDIATYLPAQSIWEYEAQGEWWKRDPSPGTRALMAAELRSIRRNGILSDSDILDVIGDERLESRLSLPVRTGLRKAARRAAAEGRPFTDADMFASVAGGARDLIGEMVECMPLPELREVTGRALQVLLSDDDQITQVTMTKVAVGGAPAGNGSAVPTLMGVPRVGPKPTSGAGKTPPPTPADRRGSSSKDLPGMATPKPERIPAGGFETEGPPEPDDDLAFLEEVSGRI